MFPTMPGTPLTAPTGTPADLSAQGGGGEGGGESSTTAVNVPSVITFVTGNAKKRKEVEEILLTYQTSFQLVAEKVRGRGGGGALGAAVSALCGHRLCSPVLSRMCHAHYAVSDPALSPRHIMLHPFIAHHASPQPTMLYSDTSYHPCRAIHATQSLPRLAPLLGGPA